MSAVLATTWPGSLEPGSDTSSLVAHIDPVAWSRCTAVDPPAPVGTIGGLQHTCGAYAPYTAHLRPPSSAAVDVCFVWFCPAHAARFRADPRAVERLVQLRTTAPGSAHRPTERSTEHP